MKTKKKKIEKIERVEISETKHTDSYIDSYGVGLLFNILADKLNEVIETLNN